MKSGFRKSLHEELVVSAPFVWLSQLCTKFDQPRSRILEEMAILRRRGAVKVVARRENHRQRFGKNGGRPQDIKYAVAPSKVRELLEKRSLKPGTGCDRQWRVVRAMRQFSRHDYCQLAGVSMHNARHLTVRLRNRGMIVYEGRGRWRLARDPGPTRPV